MCPPFPKPTIGTILANNFVHLLIEVLTSTQAQSCPMRLIDRFAEAKCGFNGHEQELKDYRPNWSTYYSESYLRRAMAREMAFL